MGTAILPQVGIALKPFLPQLQTTFTKALQDSNRGVRLKAADALGKLISIHIKVDPLFTELLNGIRVVEDPGIRCGAVSLGHCVPRPCPSRWKAAVWSLG